MPRWSANPVLLELNAWTWLNRLQGDHPQPMTLGTVPQEELERLAGIHPDAIWLMGVWERSPRARSIALQDAEVMKKCRAALPELADGDVVGSPYSVRRYHVDDHLGGDNDLDVLRGRLQRLGLGLVLDFVPNHLAPDHPWVESHPERFVLGTTDDLKRRPDDYLRVGSGDDELVVACGRDGFFPPWRDTVQLDYRRADTRQAMADELLRLSQRCDGVRCDMAHLLTRTDFLRIWGGAFDDPTAEFWADAIERAKADAPDFALIGEAYWVDDDDRGFALQELGFDFTYDDRLYHRLSKLFEKKGTVGDVVGHLHAAPEYQGHLVRYVENHDERRAAERFGSDSFAAAVLALTLPGMRLLHDRQAEGYRVQVPVQLGRQPDEPVDDALSVLYGRLLDVVAEPAFRDGSWALIEVVEAWSGNPSHRSIVASQWKLADASFLVVVNLAADCAQCYVKGAFGVDGPGVSLLTDRLGETSLRRSDRRLRRSGLYLDLPGFGYHVLSIGTASDAAHTFGLASPIHGSGLVHRRTIDWQPSAESPAWDSTFGMAWSPDSARLALSDVHFHISVWDGDLGVKVSEVGGHSAPVTSLSWSPDATMMASGSNDASVAIWDVDGGRRRRTLSGHDGPVLAVDWSPVHGLVASGSMDRTVRVWDVNDGDVAVVSAHADSVNAVGWAPDGQTLASGAGDRTVKLWDSRSRRTFHVLRGTNWISSIAWSPDGRFLAAGTGDGSIHLWDASTWRLLTTLYLHTQRVLGLAFNRDGSLLASKSNDGTVRLVRSDDWTELARIDETGYFLTGISFHPHLPLLATRDDESQSLRIWTVDPVVLARSVDRPESIEYTNAKVVLVGDSGVGKSGLAIALLRQPFQPTESTHAGRVSVFDSSEATVEGQLDIRETLLWDLAGQPGYRLVHQLHLDDVTVALVLFDARNDVDPFAGVRYWDRALTQASRLRQGDGPALTKILVEARVDRGGASVSTDQVEALVRERGFHGFVATSAKAGVGIDELSELIRASIPWSELPKIRSGPLFDHTYHFLVQEKEAGPALRTLRALFRHYVSSSPELKSATATPGLDLEEEFVASVARLESRGLLRRLSFGDLVLLRPELLDSYAASLVAAAKKAPDGLGSIGEEDARAGRFAIDSELKVYPPGEEELLLIATVEDLLSHEIALREVADGGACLVFPSELMREGAQVLEQQDKIVVFRFEGALLNVYATLAVRLSGSGLFRRTGMWRNAVTFEATVGGSCGLALVEIDEARGELSIFFGRETSEAVRVQFEGYVRTHLDRRALPGSVSRTRVFRCETCTNAPPIDDVSVALRRERGYDFARCVVCENVVSLLDWGDRLRATAGAGVVEMDRSADKQRQRGAAASVVQGKEATNDFDVFLCYHTPDRQAVMEVGEGLKRRGLLPWLDEWEMRPFSRWQDALAGVMQTVKSVAVFVGPDGVGPWQDFEIQGFLMQFAHRGVPMGVVLLPGCGEQPTIPMWLEQFHWVDFRKSTPDPMEQLVWGITGERAGGR